MKPQMNLNQENVDPFPKDFSIIERHKLSAFPNYQSLVQRMIEEIKSYSGETKIVLPMNVNAFNTSQINKEYTDALDNGTCIFADGAGVVVASKMLGQPLPTRLTAADWIFELIEMVSDANQTIYFLGNTQQVIDTANKLFDERVPNHKVVGMHHGFIHKDPELEAKVIEEINTIQPDMLILGFGTPLQEIWGEKHREKLNVKLILSLGATLDYHTGALARCPEWMGDNGLEWLFRFIVEPKRLFKRYVHGNPWFLFRICIEVLKKKYLNRLSF
ncbi:MAG: WecB/TagA/CpsF family glycosyltransferase [Candidatus Caenarcaniphilales bacterium]|nr:WecB/TagA/CpsF family glycosyltransferase [Candidatus Caenarcaniphilales bacterium]